MKILVMVEKVFLVVFVLLFVFNSPTIFGGLAFFVGLYVYLYTRKDEPPPPSDTGTDNSPTFSDTSYDFHSSGRRHGGSHSTGGGNSYGGSNYSRYDDGDDSDDGSDSDSYSSYNDYYSGNSYGGRDSDSGGDSGGDSGDSGGSDSDN